MFCTNVIFCQKQSKSKRKNCLSKKKESSGISAQLVLHYFSQLIGVNSHSFLILSFHHYAAKSLSTGISQKYTPSASELLFHQSHGLPDGRAFLKGQTFLHMYIDKPLWERPDETGKL